MYASSKEKRGKLSADQKTSVQVCREIWKGSKVCHGCKKFENHCSKHTQIPTNSSNKFKKSTLKDE